MKIVSQERCVCKIEIKFLKHIFLENRQDKDEIRINELYSISKVDKDLRMGDAKPAKRYF